MNVAKAATGRALVTGATGFVGSRLARCLVESGWEVEAIVRPSSNLGLLTPVQHDINIREHDGTGRCLQQIVGAAEPDIVFHLAAQVAGDHRPEDVGSLLTSNVVFATHLVDAMARHGCRQLINTGTFWQHYDNQDYNPVNLYAATKQAFESIVRYYVEAAGLRVIHLCLFDTYGPHDPRGKLMSLLERAAVSGMTLAMSPGEQHVDLVYIDDVVAAYMTAAQRLLAGLGAPCEHFAVRSGQPVQLRKLVAMYAQIANVELDIAWGGRPYRTREVMHPWDREPLVPGWRPRVTLAEGIRRATTPTSTVSSA